MRRGSGPLDVVVCALLLAACGLQQDDARPEVNGSASADADAREFAFRGTVVSVDTTTGIVVVAGDDVPGWMMAMSMNYYVEPPEVLGTLRSGDRIRATVRAGDFQHLYAVAVVP